MTQQADLNPTIDPVQLAGLEDAFGLAPEVPASPTDAPASPEANAAADPSTVAADPGVDPGAGDPAAEVSQAVEDAAAQTEGREPDGDRFRNLQAEMDRKLAMRDSQMQEVLNKYQALLDVVAKGGQQQVAKEPEKPADPYAGLDQADPDYEFHKLRVDHKLLQEQVKQFVGQSEADKQQAVQAQAQTAWGGWVQTNNLNAVKTAFGDLAANLTPEIARQAYIIADASWRASGYEHKDGGKAFTAAIAEVRQYADTIRPLLSAAKPVQQASQASRPVPVPVRPGGANPVASAAGQIANPPQPKFTDNDAMIESLAADFRALNMGR